ncbi:hypothetical protein QN277_007204 [Acacia crassicarpa]|uniref:Ionotropic glutamate receptor L-glutamate and glycine-binding domain-containing protein n=1 Tax=Acacia crassicarpa TaxID=499986 RepID=A0AAE1IVJ1_9FABA|nr:hypothetical protein QN277_007204 [Acacia crassicarpa]
MANSNYHFYGDEYVIMIFFAVLLLTAQIEAGDDEAGSLVMEGKKKLMVGAPKKCGTIDFFVDLKLDSKNKSQVEKAQGYSIDVFNATRAYLQDVSVEYVAFANEDGSCVENCDAILDHLSETKYDVVVGDVTIMAKRSNCVDFTLPYKQSDLKMLVKFRPDPRLV